MMLACTAALRSPDPNTQVGAYICNTANKPISSGYNGTPRGIDPETIPWEREGDPLKTKYPFVAHAEKNAILNATTSVAGGKLYVTMYPCNGCAIDIIQAGISEIIFLTNPYKDLWQTKAAAWMLEQAGVQVRQHKWDRLLIKQNLERFLKLLEA
jgi:dCMP deaminase